MKRHLRIQEDYMVQMNHDMILKCIKALFSTVKNKGTGAINQEASNILISFFIKFYLEEIVLFILEEMTKEISEIVSALKKETQNSLRKELLKSLENICSCMLFCLEILVDQDLKFLNDFFMNDFIYYIMQVFLTYYSKLNIKVSGY